MTCSAARLAVHTASRSISVRRRDRRAQGSGKNSQLGSFGGGKVGNLGNVFDAQVERAYVAARHRQVRRRADRRQRLGGVQRVDEHEGRAEVAGRPAGEVGQVTQVPVAPGVPGAQRVQLQREAPGTAPRHRGADVLGVRAAAPGLAGGGNLAEGVEDRGQRRIADRHLAPGPVPVGDVDPHGGGPLPQIPQTHRAYSAAFRRAATPSRAQQARRVVGDECLHLPRRPDVPGGRRGAWAARAPARGRRDTGSSTAGGRSC